jgi:hypothetical protein
MEVLTVVYHIDDMQCEATLTYKDWSKHLRALSVPALLKKVDAYIMVYLKQAGINTNNL